MKLLDLFCGAGGAAMGYYQAGFTDITGIDIKPQKRYPFKFVQGDALEYLEKFGAEYDVIHASPPCQGYSLTIHIHKNSSKKKKHLKLIEPVRKLLQATGKPYIIENVSGARSHLINPLMLCGTMFGLQTFRHRYFEINPSIIFAPFTCYHWGKTLSNNAKVKNRRVVQSFNLASFITIAGHDYKLSDGKIAMGIDWMTRDELNEAIPPIFTKWIGERLLEILQGEKQP